MKVKGQKKNLVKIVGRKQQVLLQGEIIII